MVRPFEPISWIDTPFALANELAAEGIDTAFTALWNDWLLTIGPNPDSITLVARPDDDPRAEDGELVFIGETKGSPGKPLELPIHREKVLEQTYALLALLIQPLSVFRPLPDEAAADSGLEPLVISEATSDLFPLVEPDEPGVDPALAATIEVATAPLPAGVVAMPIIPIPVVDAPALPPAADGVPALVPAPSEPSAGARPALTGKYLLPLEPTTNKGRPLSDVIEDLTKGSLPSGAKAVLGALQVRQGFVVISSQFKGIVLEVELTDPIGAIVRLAIAKESTLWTFGGEIIIARGSKPPLIFTLEFGKGADSTSLVAALEGEVNLVDDLLRPMFGDRVSIPDGFGLSVKNPMLVVNKQGDVTKVLVSVSLGMSVDFADLPFVGESMKATGSPQPPTLNLSVLYATGRFLDPEIAAINSVVSEGMQLPRVTDGGLDGLLLSAAFLVTGDVYPLCVPLSKETSAPPAAASTTPSLSKDIPLAAAKPRDSKEIKWFDVNKSVGPVRLRRVGAGYWDSAVQFQIGASVQVSALTFSVEGLGGGLTLTWPPKPSFNLDGLGIGLESGSISVSGELLRTVESGIDSYNGTATIKASDFTIAGLGSYSTIAGDPSLFIFAVLYRDLGGPSFFHVTGLAAGFGYNRALKLPPIDQVQSFPLIRAALDERYLSGAGNSLQTTLTTLRDYIAPSPGRYWFAVGVRFTSFELLESVALLAFSFGKETVISVLGLSRLTIPKGAPHPIAFAELQLRAELNLSTGSLAVEGRLSENSFILDRQCRLTGGFAFCTWFAGEHSGDFVVTIGGYHPRFLRPLHYPIVPRVGIDWPISSNLRITGELYFALTPSCLMAGGRLAAVFQDGGLKAWFIAYSDFLLQWQPFHYEIEAGLSLGVSYTFSALGIRFTLKVELSVDLNLWGPPFAGRARITWYIISFTIRFGNQDSAPPPPLTWKQFADALLPANRAFITVQVRAGLISQGTVNGVDWPVVNAHELALATASAAPATTISLNGMPVHTPGNDCDAAGNPRSYGVQPMAARTFTSHYALGVTRLDGMAYTKTNIVPAVVRQGVPAAMWSPRESSREPTAEVLANVPIGLALTFPTPEPTHELLPVDLKNLAYEDIGKEIVWRVDLVAAEPIPAPGTLTLMGTLEDATVRQRRLAIVAALQMATPASALDAVDLQLLAKTADRVYQASPRIARLGQPLT